MMLTRDDLIAIECAVIAGWPAIGVERIDGWIARWSSGGSVRANSVAAIEFTGPDLDQALDRVVAFYRAKGGVPKFTITDVAAPGNLDAELAARGWRRTGDHVTMAKDIASGDVARRQLPSAALPVEIERLDDPTPAWSAVYLQGLSENRRAIAMRLVQGTPAPRAFFAAKRDGDVIASGMTVLDGTLASVQCMATLASARRTGAAAAVLAAIEDAAAKHGATRIYLQTDSENLPAISLYSRVGFGIIGRYHTRELAS